MGIGRYSQDKQTIICKALIIEGRRKKEEGRRTKEEGRGKKEEEEHPNFVVRDAPRRS
jgi:hypothetical protein